MMLASNVVRTEESVKKIGSRYSGLPPVGEVPARTQIHSRHAQYTGL